MRETGRRTGSALPVSGLLVAVSLVAVSLGCSAERGSSGSAPAGQRSEHVEAPSTTAAATTSTTTTGPPAPTLAPILGWVPPRVYVPNGRSDTVSVIDPVARRVVSTFRTSREPQHVVPSWDLKTLWVLDNAGNHLIPIDPWSGRPGPPVHVDDPYNLYFTPDGGTAIVVAEARRRLDLRDPQTMALRGSVPAPDCAGINHIDFPATPTYLVATCEFAGRLAKVSFDGSVVMLDLPRDPSDGALAMPQDVRVGPDGHTFFVADMVRGGLYVVDGQSFAVQGFVPTGVGAHGITPSRDGTKLYVANRGSRAMPGPPHGPGSVATVDVASMKVVADWPVPGGGSPDMGNLSTDGTELWLSGRFDREVYVFDLVHGGLSARIPVGDGPHGLTYWPQPGSHSLGHTGNMR